MAETTKPDLTYVCPNCGQKALVGTHFCRTIPEDPRPRHRREGGGNRGFYGLIAAFLVLVLLWRWLGPGSLILAGVGTAGILLWFGARRTGGVAAYRQLVVLCKDAATAERLIAGEIKRNPALSRKDAVDQALARYRRDLER